MSRLIRSDADRIELRGLRVLGVHGALPEEQDRAQPFEVDLDVEADLSVAGASDDLADTVDYGALAAVVAAVVGGERFRLLERLAERMAAQVADADPRIRAVTVTVRKLRPPVPVDLASAGVRITRPPTVPPSAGGGPFLGLGSNLGDRIGDPADGGGGPARRGGRVARLRDRAGRRARRPAAVPQPGGRAVDRPRRPAQLLEVARRLEAAAGRVRAERCGPRTLDVDVLLVGDVVVDEPDLVVPHPRMCERRFVLAPLADLAPDLVPARTGTKRRSGEVRAGR